MYKIGITFMLLGIGLITGSGVSETGIVIGAVSLAGGFWLSLIGAVVDWIRED